MQAPLENTPTVQAMAPTREGEAGSGNAEFEDNRVSTFQLRKLHGDMGGRPEDECTAQLRNSMRTDQGQAGFPIQRKANRTGLPNRLKSGVENLSGFSMDDVKVHYNSSKPAQLKAHAYAQGTDIHVGPGQEKHLAHEAWHVVQQKQGRVKPTRQMKSKVNINDDAGLEKEADVMGAKALQEATVQRVALSSGRAGGTGVVQRVERETRPGQFLGELLDKMEETVTAAGVLEPQIQAIDLTEFEQDKTDLEVTLEAEDDEAERIKAIDDFLAKHNNLIEEVHRLDQASGNYKIAHKDGLRKLGKSGDEVANFEATGNMPGMEATVAEAIYGAVRVTRRLANVASGLNDTTSQVSFDLRLRRVEELAERRVHKDHVAGLPNADIYIPASGKTNRVSYVAHGDHTKLKGTTNATFKAVGGVTMSYTAPHGYDALASLNSAWDSSHQGQGRAALFNFSPGPISRRLISRRWYDYDLTPENGHTGNVNRVNLQGLADAHGTTMVVIKEDIRTSAFVPQLKALGYTNFFPVHCRGIYARQSQMWAAKNYEEVSRFGYGVSLVKDTYHNAVSDPGPQRGKDLIISREDLLKAEAFIKAGTFAALSEANLQNGIVVYNNASRTFHWVFGLSANQAYLRGLSATDAGLMGTPDDEFEPMEDDSPEEAQKLVQEKAKAEKLRTYHQRLDKVERLTPTKLTSYENFK